MRTQLIFSSSFEAPGIMTADCAASRNCPLAPLEASGYASAPAPAIVFQMIFTGLRRGTEAPARGRGGLGRLAWEAIRWRIRVPCRSAPTLHAKKQFPTLGKTP